MYTNTCNSDGEGRGGMGGGWVSHSFPRSVRELASAPMTSPMMLPQRSGLRCLSSELASGVWTANRPSLTKSCKSTGSPLYNELESFKWKCTIELIVSSCAGEEFDQTELSGWGVELLGVFCWNMCETTSRAEQSGASFGRNFVWASSSLTFPNIDPGSSLFGAWRQFPATLWLFGE